MKFSQLMSALKNTQKAAAQTPKELTTIAPDLLKFVGGAASVGQCSSCGPRCTFCRRDV